MKTLIFLFLWCISTLSIFSQATEHSYWGNVHTPNGELHGLVVFIGFNDTDEDDDVDGWAHDEIPEWAQGDYNEIFDIDDSQIGEVSNITSYYSAMSEGQFIFTGEVFPDQIMVNRTLNADLTLNTSAAVQDAMDVLATYTTFDWSRFDQRKNSCSYDFDNSLYSNTALDPAAPDGKLDYVAVIVRNFDGGFHGSTGTLGGGDVYYGVNTYEISNGNNSIGSGTDPKSYRTWFYHETAHNLYNSPHFFQRNGTVGKYYYATSGWGFIGSIYAPFDCANAWERWWCGWINPQTVTTNGTYVIKDYLTEGDAIRIPLPYDYATAGETPQYLWIENHQMISDYDDKPFYGAEAVPSSGLYMFITARGDTRESPNDVTVFNPNCNMIKTLNAEGRFDFTVNPTKLTVPNTGGDQYVFTRGAANPIAGQSDYEYLRNDFDDVGSIIEVAQGANQETDLGPDTRNDIQGFWAENIGGTPTATYSVTGDANLAFDVGDELSLSGIMPILNHTQYKFVDEPLETPPVFIDAMNPYYLNGLKVYVSSYNATTKEYTIQVTFEDWEVRSAKRWCGNLFLPADKDLVVKENIVLTVDKSGTPNRRTVDATHGLINPTSLNMKSGSSITLKNGSTLLVKNYSTLTIEAGAELIIEQNAKLQIESNAKVVLEPGGTIRCTGSSAKIVVEDDGLLLMNGNDIELNNSSAKLELKAGGTIETDDDVDFTFTGTGYLYYYQNGIFVFGDDSKFILQGTGTTDRKMWVGTNALLYIDGHDVEVSDCRIDYNSGSTFKVSENYVTFDNVFANDGAGSAGHAIHADNTEELTVTSSDFDGFNSTILLEDIDICPNGLNVMIDYSTFVHHDFAAVEAYNVERMRFFTSTAQGATSVAAGLFLEDVDECLVDNSTIKDYPVNSVDAAGIFAHRVGALIIDGSSIRNNYEGIEARATNIFVRNSAVIKNNTNGIYAISSEDGTSNPTMMYRLVVGDEGCGWIINNTKGVIGEDILLDIDQMIHALAHENPFPIYPNRFDGNSTYSFEVCYDYYDIDDITYPIPAKHNYWTSGTAPSTSNYKIGDNAACNNISIDGSEYYTTQPTSCDCVYEDCDEEPTEESIELRLSDESCDYLINKNGGGRITIGNQYRDAYMLFTEGSYNYAYQKFNWLKNRVEAEYSAGLPEGVCDQQYISAMGLKKISEILATVYCQYPFWIDDREAIFFEPNISKFLLFPNPTQTLVTLGSLEGITADYEIRTLTGEIITTGHLEGSVTIDVSTYTKGMYLVIFRDEYSVIIETQKMIVQ